jgi:hypothetical protein
MARYIVYFHPGDPVPDRIKYVDDATTAPDANDDAATLGVTVGSLWIDTVAEAVYVCIDATTAAAVWVEVSGGGSAITELDDIPDVNAPSPSDGQVLTWDSTPGEWVAATPTGGSGGVGELIVSEDITDPPETVWTEDGTDWVYGEP